VPSEIGGAQSWRVFLQAPAGSRSNVSAFAISRTEPDFQHLAGFRIDEALAGEAPVPSWRRVQRAPLVTAAPEEEPDQNERDENPGGEKKSDHGSGSITAAVP